MDHTGNLAIGYTASGPDYFPSLHYAGRLATDPLNELSQGEAVMFQGQGIEVNTGVNTIILPALNRWGDYSALTVDPSDDCTFWYTNEYLGLQTGASDVVPIHWRTRIASFKFPQCATPSVQLLSVASRKQHGSAGTFDVPLPGGDTPGIEPRSGGPSGEYTMIFTFSQPAVTCGLVSVLGGNASVSIGSDPHECVVQLTGVPNGEYITVTLANVVDELSGVGTVSGIMGVLLGDVNATGRVDAADVSVVRQQTLQPVTPSNFRADVNASGRIDAADVSIARQQTLNALPP
jgi:hypothetical protein